MTIDRLTESSSPSRVTITRRQFLTGAAAMGAGLTVLRRGGGGIADAAPLPAPDASGIEHIVLVMMENRSFDQTVLVISYDEWGGFFDHVPPPFAQIPPADQAAGNQDGQLGFRVPCLIASPFARHRVSHTVFEHTSVLRMIEWRWSLTPLTVRDAAANNLAEALTLDRRRLGLPQFDVPEGPFGGPCATTAAPDGRSRRAETR
jgi:Phosphoesterase family